MPKGDHHVDFTWQIRTSLAINSTSLLYFDRLSTLASNFGHYLNPFSKFCLKLILSAEESTNLDDIAYAQIWFS